MERYNAINLQRPNGHPKEVVQNLCVPHSLSAPSVAKTALRCQC